MGHKYLVHVLDGGALRVHAVLEDELLQVEEGALVPRVLPHLRTTPSDSSQGMPGSQPSIGSQYKE